MEPMSCRRQLALVGMLRVGTAILACAVIGCGKGGKGKAPSPADRALIWAVSREDLDVVRWCLENGADANTMDGDRPLLMYACASSDTAIAKLMIDRGANVNARDTSGEPILFTIACNTQSVELLLASGADVNCISELGDTPLHRTAVYGCLPSAEILISHGASVDAADRSGETALHLAAGKGHTDIAELLLANGSKAVNARTDLGRTPLHDAAGFGHLACVELLIAHGADFTATDNDCASPMHHAAYHGDTAVVGRLFKAGARTGPPLADAIVAGHMAKARALIADDASVVAAADSYRWTALHWAVAVGNEAAFDLLLASGADVDGAEPAEISPVDLAIKLGNERAAKALLDQGASLVLTKQKRGPQPSLYWAIVSRSPALVEMVLDQGADLNAGGYGETGLTRAANEGLNELASLLLRRGADPNVPDSRGWTPLHIACMGRTANLPLVKLLVANGANVNALEERTGATPLHHAAAGGSVAIARFLAENAAFLSDMDKKGYTPLDMARSMEMVEVLQSYGATGAHSQYPPPPFAARAPAASQPGK